MLGAVSGGFEEELAGERVSVGVQAGGGQADEHVSGFDFCAGNELVAVDDADDEAGKVVLALGVEAGHLGGFAADERAAVGPAGFGEAGDDFFGHFAVEGSGGEVIEEEERSAPCTAMSLTQWLTRSAPTVWWMPSSKAILSLVPTPSALETRTGCLYLSGVELEEAAKAADFAQDVAGEGALGEVLDTLLGTVAAGNIDPGIGVGDWTFSELRASSWLRTREFST